MNDEFCKVVGRIAIKAMLYEVSATPKPGLVDRNNSGAHRDMDYFTFIDSTLALDKTFYDCTLAGMNFQGENFSLMMNTLRSIGIEGEKRMFGATNGVNTHKGLIFSMGIISAAVGTIYARGINSSLTAELVCQRVMEITRGLSERELCAINDKDKLTYGEKVYKIYGVKGIRGEAESGFITVGKYGIPIMKQLMDEKKGNINDILVQVLLYLMAVTEDINILGRHDLSTLNYVKDSAEKILKAGGIFEDEGRTKIIQLDKEFIMRNISPGGSADLLAVTVMLYLLENIGK